MFTIKNVFASEQEKQLPYFGIPGCHNFKSRFKMNDYAVLTKTERSQETDIEQENTFAYSDIVGTFALTSRKKKFVFYTISFIMLINL